MNNSNYSLQPKQPVTVPTEGKPSDLQVLALDPLDRVTGSCTLVFHPKSGTRVLVDCGAYQGREQEELNAADFPFDPRAIDKVLLTHAHLDHCGRLPHLVRDGFRGQVIATQETIEIAKIVLADSVKILGDRKLKKAFREIRWRAIGEILFSKPTKLAPGLSAAAFRSAHILGAVGWDVVAGSGKQLRRVRFSGDIGCNEEGSETQPWQRHRVVPSSRADLVVVESTYGGRARSTTALDPIARRERLVQAIQRGLAKGGPVIIPVFAIQRAQDLLLDLHIVMMQNPDFLKDTPLYYDAPMALKVHPVFAEAIRREQVSLDGNVRPMWLSKQVFDDFGLDEASLADTRLLQELLSDLLGGKTDTESRKLLAERANGDAAYRDFRVQWHQVWNPRQRRALVASNAPSVVICTGGMCGGGPVQSWLEANLERENATVLTTGYASPDTVAGQLIALSKLPASRRCRLSGSIDLRDASIAKARVRADIAVLSGWSGHAGQASLVRWLFQSERPPAHVWVQHGETSSREALQHAVEARAKQLDLNMSVFLPCRDGHAFDLGCGKWIDRWSVLGRERPADARPLLQECSLIAILEGLLNQQKAS